MGGFAFNMSAMRVRSPVEFGSGFMLSLNYGRKMLYGIVVYEQGKRSRFQYESTKEIKTRITEIQESSER